MTAMITIIMILVMIRVAVCRIQVHRHFTAGVPPTQKCSGISYILKLRCNQGDQKKCDQ